jgi:hypothetical protein
LHGRGHCAGRKHFPEENPVTDRCPRLCANRFQLPPLVEREHFAQIQIHESKLTFQLASSRQHLIHLRLDLSFVGYIGIE